MVAPIPEGCKLIDEVTVNDGKYTVRLLHKENERGHMMQRWQALRYGEDWPACPYPSWSPDNLTMALFQRVVNLEAGQ